jgi:signal transduction histidine kinase/CheY-like chemotaxis protein
MLGTTQNENISKNAPTGDSLPFRIFRNGNEVPPENLPMQRACREGRDVLDEELEIVRSDGMIVHELCRATPLRDEQNNVRGCIGVFLNITERKQGEREREHLLALEQLARAEAEAASHVKDEFLAIVSHELRTPLHAILGWTHLLRSNRLAPLTASQALQTIERNAKAQAKLVDDLLDVSRIISGKLQLDLRSVELRALIHTAVDALRYILDDKEIHLEMIMEPSDSSIEGDAHRLQQVVWNLLSNAAKFTPKGGRIEIRLEHKHSNVQLTVRDTGEGIHPEFLPYVFDRFRQADSSRTRKHGGLGLGLAIVRHLIEMHGGSVNANSAGENQGATFTVTLPLSNAVHESPGAAARALAQPGHTPRRLAGVRLLIVEDDPDSLEVMRTIAESHGAEVRTSTSTDGALHVLKQWLPDVLISDLGLPDEDGYELIQKANIVSCENAKQIPAIALTGYAGDHERRSALTSGFQKYFAKPAEPAKLVEAIEELAMRAKT